jgi:hypothetical protein
MRNAETVTRRVHRVLTDRGVDHATVELRSAAAGRRGYLDAHAH